ncbi:hypothetical protein DVJ83_13015 [Deinococcus wulumuqiensis]|uniref:Uncharacterized protein n=1 Tax=Deinococcus wulumuqiensis TaxID=980427 RepID=A0A345IJL5_9DEIO|nr:hypothetical protein DVJ83_13015 [Deinococcus wulumuqiensis]
MFGVAGGLGLAVVHTLEGRLVLALDLMHFLLVALVLLGEAGVALVLVVFVRHGGSVSRPGAASAREGSTRVER